MCTGSGDPLQGGNPLVTFRSRSSSLPRTVLSNTLAGGALGQPSGQAFPAHSPGRAATWNASGYSLSSAAGGGAQQGVTRRAVTGTTFQMHSDQRPLLARGSV